MKLTFKTKGHEMVATVNSIEFLDVILDVVEGEDFVILDEDGEEITVEELCDVLDPRTTLIEIYNGAVYGPRTAAEMDARYNRCNNCTGFCGTCMYHLDLAEPLRWEDRGDWCDREPKAR